MSKNTLMRPALYLVATFAAVAVHAITWEGTTNLVMTAATTVEVPAGRTNVIEELSGAYTLTKTGGGALEIRYVKTASASVVVSEGLVRFAEGDGEGEGDEEEDEEDEPESS